MGVVSTNTLIDNVSNGMHLSDNELGFGTHNYGCCITFCSSTSSDTESILITWQEVLDGKKRFVSMEKGDIYLDVYSNFVDRSRTSQGLTGLMNSLYAKVYGDRLQCLNLIKCYNRAIMKYQMKLVRGYEDIIYKYNPVVLVGEVYESLLDTCNDSFGAAIKKYYSDFVAIGQPIINRDEINGLVELHKNKMSHHYHTMYTMMGYKKGGFTRNNQ